MKLIYLNLLCLFCCLLVSCNEVETLAPVTELSIIDPIPKTGVHHVLKGETLYEIAWRYGLDYRYLAKRNEIYAPYAIFVGQKIYLQGRKTIITKPKTNLAEVSMHQPTKIIAFKPLPKTVKVEPNYAITKWYWPTKKSASNRVMQSGKGVNIYGQLGEPIYAAGPGRVVYAGSGLRGYGNLIILKHNSLYLSAYAHNKSLVVKEGDWVKRGQKIAEMGNTGTNRVMLHFEIRRGGQMLNLSSLARSNQI